MQALVVVESVFGNTRLVGEAVAEGLAARMTVDTIDVADAPIAVSGIDLLLVGGPTHAFGMTRVSTRQSASEQSGGAVAVAATGLREWLESLDTGHGKAAATFDTRLDRPRLPGSAGSAAARRLRRLGYHLIAGPMTFRVLGTQGPLVEGEEKRARRWAEGLAAQFAGPYDTAWARGR